MPTLPQSLQFLTRHNLAHHLGNLNRGLEKESLRVDADGNLAQTPHPRALGSALTHPSITTDYSEALLEFVTPVHTQVPALLTDLFRIHQFTYHHLPHEKLWVNSMPCLIQDESRIPIARYGKSNIAQMKEIYRRGLQLRYGGLMQTVAGIHFNFSLPQPFWRDYLRAKNRTPPTPAEIQTQKSTHYFALIRNFHRHSWLPCYLFGASPAVCKSFVQGRAHHLQNFDPLSCYAPHATTLRLSDLGYHSLAQSTIKINYNSAQQFIKSLRRAMRTPHPRYQKLGVKSQADQTYHQLSTAHLQIENEFYSVIRPKRVTQKGEPPSTALQTRGVQYVEVRSVDLNPFLPIGIDAECIRFLDLLLLYCLLTDSPPLHQPEWQTTLQNRQRVVMHGRKPGLTLDTPTSKTQTPLTTAATHLLTQMQPLAQLLDANQTTNPETASKTPPEIPPEIPPETPTPYQTNLQTQLAKIHDPTLTPSAQILQTMTAHNQSFYEFAMHRAQTHDTMFKKSQIPPPVLAQMQTQAQQSLAAHHQIETQTPPAAPPFPTYLAEYYRRAL